MTQPKNLNKIQPKWPRSSWHTPSALLDEVEVVFGPIDLDVAATSESAVCNRFFTVKDDGLVQPWEVGLIWCHPPHERLDLWVDKAIYSVLDENRKYARVVVMLLPARTHTKWFQSLLAPTCAVNVRIQFLEGAVKFVAPDGVTPKTSTEPQMLVVLTDNSSKRLKPARIVRMIDWPPNKNP